MESKLGRFPVSISIPVAWGEMDAFQHVNNVVYARWIESARIAYFGRIGLLERMRSEGVGPILGRVAIDFRRPVTFPDTVRVEVTTRRFGNSSFTMGYRLRSAAQDAEVALGEDVIVVLDYRTGKKVPLDARLKEAIRGLEASGGA